MRIFVNHGTSDANFYREMYDFLRLNGITRFRRNLLTMFDGKTSGLFNPLLLDKELSHPDFAIVILSEDTINDKDQWIGDEIRALCMLEQFRKRPFVIPILTGSIKDEDIPNYFNEHPEKIFDCRSGNHNAVFDKVLNYIKKNSGGKVFIGHGRSSDWIHLRDFMRDELKVECDVFEVGSKPGISIKERLVQMLENAYFAFIIMTGDDTHADNNLHARENVIHEIGLFQGRLGFDRAVVLLEEGCHVFSNTSGIIHVEYVKGKIETCFHEVRKVLVSQGIISM